MTPGPGKGCGEEVCGFPPHPPRVVLRLAGRTAHPGAGSVCMHAARAGAPGAPRSQHLGQQSRGTRPLIPRAPRAGMPLRPRAPRGGAGGRRRLRGAGERDRPPERSGCVDTARPCPRALPSAGMWLASGLCWRRRPLLCPERQLMQYRSPIVKRPLCPPVFPKPWPPRLPWKPKPTSSAPPKCQNTLDVMIFIHANQSQDLPQRRRRGPGWLPSP